MKSKGMKVAKLKDNDLRCATCEGELIKVTKADLKKVNIVLKYGFSKGVWKCKDCGEIFAITVVLTSRDMLNWEEEIHKVSSDGMLEMSKLVDMAIDLATTALVGPEPEIISISEVLKCEGLGCGCRHYWLASCGVGIESICGDKWCRYDPYFPEWYRKMSIDKILKRISTPLPSMIPYWLDKIKREKKIEDRTDALRRLGSIVAVDEVKMILVNYAVDQNVDFRLRKIAIDALSNISDPEKVKQLKNYFLNLLSEKGEHSLKIRRSAMLAIRRMGFVDVELMETIAALSTKDALRKEAVITLRILEKIRKIRKRS